MTEPVNPWCTAVPDWQERLMAGASLVPRLPLLDAEAARAVRIFRRLRLPDVSGTPTFAEAGFDWLLPVVAALFGSYDVELKRRMIQEVFLAVPKKNGKSTGGAGIMLTAMIMNDRPAAEGVMVAPTKEIADISYRQAAGMVRLDEKLAAIFEPTRHQRTIRDLREDRGGAKMQIKAADVDALTGGTQCFALIDETHVFANKAGAADVFLELRGALAARLDGFLMQITTQSKAPPSGVFRAELTRARAVRDGSLDLPLLPVLYELPQAISRDGGWKKRAFWRLINPNLGRSVDEAFLEREIRSAEEEGPHKLALIASQHFNVEIGVGLMTDRWAGADYWESSTEAELDLDSLIKRSEIAVIGIDGGGLDDLLGLAVIGRESSGRWLLWNHAWAHPIALERRKSEAPRLLDLAKEGDLDIVGQLGDDIEAIVDIVEKLADAGLLPKKNAVGLDPVGIGQIIDALSDRGISEEQIVGVTQGWKLTGAIKTAERKLADGTMVHAGQGLMRWCVGNARVEPKGNAITITKQMAGTAKIDPLMATFNAVALMSMAPATHIYADGRPLLVI